MFLEPVHSVRAGAQPVAAELGRPERRRQTQQPVRAAAGADQPEVAL